jgi:hypothetical protein
MIFLISSANGAGYDPPAQVFRAGGVYGRGYVLGFDLLKGN